MIFSSVGWSCSPYANWTLPTARLNSVLDFLNCAEIYSCVLSNSKHQIMGLYSVDCEEKVNGVEC